MQTCLVYVSGLLYDLIGCYTIKKLTLEDT